MRIRESYQKSAFLQVIDNPLLYLTVRVTERSKHAMEKERGTSSASGVAPCAACRIRRRRCGDRCKLAPYFPSHQDMEIFASVHKVFGASNVVRIIQQVPSERREDAARSLVYEAWARSRDPVYGCAGIVSRMYSYISLLQSHIASAHAHIAKLRMDNTGGALADADAESAHPQQRNDISALESEEAEEERMRMVQHFGDDDECVEGGFLAPWELYVEQNLATF